MKRVLFSLLLAVSAHCAQVEQPGYKFSSSLDQREMFKIVESFFGHEFDGEKMMEKERKAEKFYIDWEEDVLWRHLLERRKECPAGTILRRYPNAISVLFIFFRQNDARWDVSEKQLIFRLEQARVKSAFWLESNYFGLTAKPLSLEPQSSVETLTEAYLGPN